MRISDWSSDVCSSDLVAGILSEKKLDTASIVTGLLHDTVEDTVATLDDIERHFGTDIARLVDGVTKLGQLELQSDKSKQAENFRKLVLAMSQDKIGRASVRERVCQYV